MLFARFRNVPDLSRRVLLMSAYHSYADGPLHSVRFPSGGDGPLECHVYKLFLRSIGDTQHRSKGDIQIASQRLAALNTARAPDNKVGLASSRRRQQLPACATA